MTKQVYVMEGPHRGSRGTIKETKAVFKIGGVEIVSRVNINGDIYTIPTHDLRDV